MVFRSSKQYNLLEEKFITIIYHQMIHLNYKEDLKNDIDVFKESIKQKNQSKIKKIITLRNAVILLNGKQKVINSFEPEYF